MKIERLSENQIRCTLYKSDLAEKELLLTELAYGTDKAKELFRELMQQASDELGFEVDNVPLMIEAIPVSQECLILVITKVEDPEELDTRFSRFTKPAVVEDEEDSDFEEEEDDLPFKDELPPHAKAATDGLVEALSGLVDGISSAIGNRMKGQQRPKQEKKEEVNVGETFRIYAFKSLDQVILSANLVKNIYKSENSLYKNPNDSHFYLYMTKDKNTDGEFIRTCNIIGEYSNRIRATYATPNHMEEHFKLIINANALQTLAEI